MKTILVPYDFSETAGDVLNYAVGMAKDISANLVLLHVDQVPVVNSEFGLTGFSLADERQETLNSLSQLCEKIKLTTPELNKITYYSEMGSITEVITTYVSKHQIDFTVMGVTWHGSRLMQNLVGSNSIAVSKSIDCPLIIVPPHATFKQIKNIAYCCAYDQKLETGTSLQKVKLLNTLLNSTLHILHVIPENHELTLKESQFDQYIEQEFENLPHRTFIIKEKKISEALINFITHHNIDMIIIEPRKHFFLYNLFNSSTTNDIVFHSPIPVLAIHE